MGSRRNCVEVIDEVYTSSHESILIEDPEYVTEIVYKVSSVSHVASHSGCGT